MIYGNKIGGERDAKTYIIEGNGVELIGVVVDEFTMFDASSYDVRTGKVFACNEGVMVGSNDAPSFRFTNGISEIAPGDKFLFKVVPHDHLNYTILTCMIAPVSNPYKIDRVVIEGNVFNSEGVKIAEAVVDEVNKVVDLNIVNNTAEPYLLYFFIGTEE